MDSEQGDRVSNISIFTVGFYRGPSTRSRMGQRPPNELLPDRSSLPDAWKL